MFVCMLSYVLFEFTQVVLEGFNADGSDLITQGREKMIPSYVDDFSRASNEARVLSEPEQRDTESNDVVVGVRVTLLALAIKKVLEVTYVLRRADNVMVEHRIHSIKDAP